MQPKHIIFFDGSCGLCHRSVQFILSRDKKELFHFSPLDSQYSSKALVNVDSSADTFYLKSDEIIYQKAEAWIKTLFLLGGTWKLIAIALKQIPTATLDIVYDFIAKYRKQIFGTKTNCDLLSKDQKNRFLF